MPLVPMSLFEETTASNAPPALDLNEGQAAAAKAICAFLAKHLDRRSHRPKGEKPSEFGLFGAAGTGKTSVIGQVFGHMRPYDRVCFAAPTHKAAGVLKQKAPAGIECSTVHRLLGCKKIKDTTDGEIKFLPDANGGMFGLYDVIVIDECSMVGDKLAGWIYSAAQKKGTILIWMGDPYQLQPVADGDFSPTFDIPTSCELTEIMRHQGAIQSACDHVRQAIVSGRLPKPARAVSDDHGKIIQWPNTEAGVDKFLHAFLQAPECSKALAFKNDDVDFLNGYLRKMIYGDDPRPFIAGERLTFARAYEPPAGGLVHTESECVVVEAEQSRRHGLACWRLILDVYGDIPVQVEAFTFGGKQERVRYQRKLSELKEEAEATRQWQQYFELKEAFATVRPGYATTIHKSQGSTYERVFLLQSEMLGVASWNPEMLARLLYVAYSRTSKELNLI